MKTLALSALCEHPGRRTGLSTFFAGFVATALRLRPDLRWVVFAGPNQEWTIDDPRVEVRRDYPANDRRNLRLHADHFLVPAAARRRGADALLTVGFMPARPAGLPVVMHVFSVRHLRPGGGLRSLYRRAALARGLAAARLVIVNSRWALDQLGPFPAPSLVSHEGLDRARFAPAGPAGAEALPGLPPGYLLWSSNFYAYKRADRLLAAYGGLPAALRTRWPLVLAGGDWEGGRAAAEQAAQASGVGQEVRFLGWVDDAVLPALYRGARAHALPTTEETFGRSVTEAMACGCPCVLQDLPVLREVAGPAALFADFARPPAGTQALRAILEDDALHARLREAGLRRAADFSFEKLVRERLEAIERVLSK